MSEYFRYFPNVTHTNTLLKDITKRIKFVDTVLNDPYAYLPYTIVQDDRPEDIALYYYGSVRYTWLVYFSAGMLDPYKDWPLPSNLFDKYFIKKYEQQSGTTGNAVLLWGQNETITDNIIYYINRSNPDLKISKDTFTLDNTLVQGDWRAVRYHEYEVELNESKRVINLLDERFAAQAERELRELLDG